MYEVDTPPRNTYPSYSNASNSRIDPLSHSEVLPCYCRCDCSHSLLVGTARTLVHAEKSLVMEFSSMKLSAEPLKDTLTKALGLEFPKC